MAKGSQLSQLKSALSQAGITGNQNQGKKRKRPASVEKDKAKKAAKLEEIHRRLNPFDVKVTKLKHDVGGRKVKGVTGKPAQSKQAGIEQRKKTLLKEFKDKDRAGGVVDRRFGENDPSMSIEERMLERFTRERQRASKGATFNLEDEDELTHYGQSLSKLDDFDNVGLGLEDEDEDEDSGKIDGDVVKSAHFGGFDGDEDEDESEEPARKKSKAEVMAEVIAKSKEHKVLRQIEKEKEENVRHELDQDFDSLRSLLFAATSSTSSEQPREARLLNDTGDADYDARVRELAFDKRAKPKDRTKTEEEIALEEKEALEKAEKQRERRMMGVEESDSEDEGRGKKRKRGGDDLEDDFGGFEEEWGGLGGGLEESNARAGAESASEAEDDEGEEEGDEEEGDDDDDDGSAFGDSEEDSEPEGDHEEVGPSSKSVRIQHPGKRKSSAKELPFTFPCPTDHEEFLSILEDVEEDDVPTVIKRIRTLYHPSLSPDNKSKLQALTTVLIDHVLYITSPPEPQFTLLTALLPHLNALIKAYPVSSAEYLVEKLSIMHKNLKRGLAKGSLEPDSKTWPSLQELSLLRLIGTTWSTSDLNHAVVSATRLLMAAYLGLGRVRSLSDITSGLFLCTIFLQFEALSKRLVPEAINFLANALLHLAPHNYKKLDDVPGAFPAPDFQSDSCRGLRISSKGRKLSPQKANLSALLQASSLDEQSKVDLLSLTVELLKKFAEMYKSLDGFIELYEPIFEILENLETKMLGDSLKASIAETKDMLQRLLKFARQARQPLLLQAHKPIPIPTYVPKFDMGSSSYLRHQDPDRERNEATKLRHQYKQERKGAIRELRKDAKFLAGVEQEKQREKDRTYHSRMKRVFGSIEVERAEEKAMEREKTKAKKRAGRK